MHDVPTLGQLRRRQRCSRDSLAIYTAVLLGVAYQPAQAGDGFNLDALPLLIVPGAAGVGSGHGWA